MAENIESLASLVYQQARNVESTFARHRARQFYTQHFATLAKFPQRAANEIRRTIPKRLAEAKSGGASEATIARTLKRYGQVLEFVHQSLDFVTNTDVRSIPSPYVLLLEELGSGFGKPSFVLQGSPLFTYSFVPIALNRPLKEAGLKSRLPDGFAAFRFPAALNEDGLQHAVLSHELGHYVDTEETLPAWVWASATSATRDRVEHILRTLIGTVPAGVGTDSLRRLSLMYASWISETICDVFAARLLGPAYLFSFIEHLGFSSDMDIGGESHPPPSMRLWVISEELRSTGWSALVKPHHKSAAPNKPTQKMVKGVPGGGAFFLVLQRCLLEALPAIRRVVRARVGDRCFRRTAHAPYENVVRDLLRHRVPPGEMHADGTVIAVPARSVINGAWFFHLAGYESWPSVSTKQLPSEYEKRQLLSRLTFKGLEISYIRKRWEE